MKKRLDHFKISTQIGGTMKNYISKNLLKNETVVYQTNIHWSVYFLPIIVGAFMLILPIFAGLAGIAGIIILAPIAGVSFLFNWLKRKFFGFAVTNKRIIAKSEFLNTLDIPLKQVESVNVDQGFWGAVFDYGSVIICGTGGTKSILNKVSDPDNFKKAVME